MSTTTIYSTIRKNNKSEKSYSLEEPSVAALKAAVREAHPHAMGKAAFADFSIKVANQEVTSDEQLRSLLQTTALRLTVWPKRVLSQAERDLQLAQLQLQACKLAVQEAKKKVVAERKAAKEKAQAERNAAKEPKNPKNPRLLEAKATLEALKAQKAALAPAPELVAQRKAIQALIAAHKASGGDKAELKALQAKKRALAPSPEDKKLRQEIQARIVLVRKQVQVLKNGKPELLKALEPIDANVKPELMKPLEPATDVKPELLKALEPTEVASAQAKVSAARVRQVTAKAALVSLQEQKQAIIAQRKVAGQGAALRALQKKTESKEELQALNKRIAEARKHFQLCRAETQKAVAEHKALKQRSKAKPRSPGVFIHPRASVAAVTAVAARAQKVEDGLIPAIVKLRADKRAATSPETKRQLQQKINLVRQKNQAAKAAVRLTKVEVKHASEPSEKQALQRKLNKARATLKQLRDSKEIHIVLTLK